MPELYVFIDTNIWIRVISQGKPGCELEHLQSLLTLINESRVVLMLPEIVELELEKFWREFKDEVVKHVGQIEKKLEDVFKPQLWTEIEDLRTAIGTFLQQQKQAKITKAEENYKRVQELFASPKVVKLPLTSELLFLGKKRLISGRMPIAENKAHNDACIVESLVGHFGKTRMEDTQLCFCSDNVNDFSLEIKNERVLHPLVKEGLPPMKYVKDLQEMMVFHQSNTKVNEPPQTEIEEALEKRVKKAAQTPQAKCSDPACNESAWILGPFCHAHFMEHHNALPESDRKEFDKTLEHVLNTLSYRQREILKLRTGLGDGHAYTVEECGRIFKCTRQRIRQIERQAIEKMLNPLRARAFEKFFFFVRRLRII